MERVRPRVSFADLERAPEDGRRYELYDGEVYVVPAPVPLHQIVQHALTEALREFCRSHGGLVVDSPVDVVFSEYDVVQPDIVFFGVERAHLVNLRAAIRHRPDLCVEILSPSTETTDRGRKLQLFARYGVPEYWIVDLDAECVEALRLDAGSYTLVQRATREDRLTSVIFPASSVIVDSLFP